MFKSEWYYSLTKPAFSPPDQIFAPIWAILYLMIISSFIFYLSTKSENKAMGYIFFFTQIILNFLWSPVFFGLKNIAYAFFIIILLDVFVLLTIRKFYSINKTSGYLLIPYFLWIMYATYLNLAYLVLNR